MLFSKKSKQKMLQENNGYILIKKYPITDVNFWFEQITSPHSTILFSE